MSTQATVTGGFSKWPGNHPGKYFPQMKFDREDLVVCWFSFIINNCVAKPEIHNKLTFLYVKPLLIRKDISKQECKLMKFIR